MTENLDSIPYPLTPNHLDQLAASSRFNEAHPEIVTSRFTAGEGTITVIPALLLVTDTTAYAVVETEDRDGYRVLASADADTEDAYDALNDWCDEHGYVDQA
jgi:hypothetical protein